MRLTSEDRSRSRVLRNVAAAVTFAAMIGGALYLRHIDWPPNDGSDELAALAGEDLRARNVYFYRSRNFMDTWDLYRFEVSTLSLEEFAARRNLELRGQVEHFPLIVSRPPPFWWRPERLPQASLWEGTDASGRSYSMMHDSRSLTTYLLTY